MSNITVDVRVTGDLVKPAIEGLGYIFDNGGDYEIKAMTGSKRTFSDDRLALIQVTGPELVVNNYRRTILSIREKLADLRTIGYYGITVDNKSYPVAKMFFPKYFKEELKKPGRIRSNRTTEVYTTRKTFEAFRKEMHKHGMSILDKN